MTQLFPHVVRGDNLTMVQSKHSTEFITVAFALLSRGWVFAAVGGLAMLVILGTYFKAREKELLDQIASLKAMVAQDLEDSRARMDKKVAAMKSEMDAQLRAEKKKHSVEKANLVAKSKAKEEKLETEITSLQQIREEYVLQIEKLHEQRERDSQEHKERVLQLKKETEDRLEAQQYELELARDAALAEQAGTVAELQKKIAALETALLHW